MKRFITTVLTVLVGFSSMYAKVNTKKIDSNTIYYYTKSETYYTTAINSCLEENEIVNTSDRKFQLFLEEIRTNKFIKTKISNLTEYKELWKQFAGDNHSYDFIFDYDIVVTKEIKTWNTYFEVISYRNNEMIVEYYQTISTSN